MNNKIDALGDSFDLETRVGGFVQVTIMSSGTIGKKVVVSCHELLTNTGLPTVADLPESASCANCLHPNMNPEYCFRRPDEDHFIVGEDPKVLLEMFSRKHQQVCPAHSSGEE